MPEVPSEKRISVPDAAEIIGRAIGQPYSRKAVEQLVYRHRQGRGGLQTWKDPGDGRVWTTQEWIDEYLASRRSARRPAGEPRRAERVFRSEPVQHTKSVEPWRTVLEELQAENLRLRLRVAELEAELRS